MTTTTIAANAIRCATSTSLSQRLLSSSVSVSLSVRVTLPPSFVREGSRLFRHQHITRRAQSRPRRRGRRGQPPHAAAAAVRCPRRRRSLSISPATRAKSTSWRGTRESAAKRRKQLLSLSLPLLSFPGASSIHPTPQLQFPSFLPSSLSHSLHSSTTTTTTPPLSPSLALQLLHTRSLASDWVGVLVRAGDSLRGGRGEGRARARARARRISWRWWRFVSVDMESDWVRSLTLTSVFFTVLVLLSFPPSTVAGVAWV